MITALRRMCIQTRKDVLIGIVIVGLIIGNIVLQIVSIRIDVSRTQANTIALASRKIVQAIQKNVDIYYFTSHNLPVKFVPLKQNVHDILKLYRSQSSKLILHELDPSQDTDAQKKAKEYGVRELEFSQADANTFAVSKGYFAVVLVSGDKKEYISDPSDIENLEYNITSAIYRLTRNSLPKVQIMEGGSSIQTMRSNMEQQYAVSPLTDTIFTDTTALVLYDTAAVQYSPTQIGAIRTYLNNGGKALLFVDGVTISDVQFGLTAATYSAQLQPVLKDFGISIKQQLVVSTAAEIINLGQYILPYPLWIKTNGYDTKSVLFRSLPYLLFQWSSPVVGGETLVHAMPQSWIQKDPFTIIPQELVQKQPGAFEKVPLVSRKQNKQKGEIVVIGTTKFVDDRYTPPQSTNQSFVFSLLDQFSTQGALSGIRSRAISLYPIPPVSLVYAEIIKWGTTLFPTILLVYGVWHVMRRK